MNTKTGKTFGLALIMAVGILAIMFALGTFSSQKAGAEISSPSLATTPANPGPGAAVGMTVTFATDDTIGGFDKITITLPDFGIPTTITERSISVRPDVGKNGNPESVDVDGDNIIMEIADLGETGGIIGVGNVEIVIKKSAGITAPAAAGTYTVQIALDDAEALDAGDVMISQTLSVDPKKGGSGTEITVTGKALANGTGTLYSRTPGIDDNDDGDFGDAADTTPGGLDFIKDVEIDGGEFSTKVDASDLEKGDTGHSQLVIVDADAGEAMASFQVTGTATVTPESVNKGEVVKIVLSDWIAEDVAAVKIAGVNMHRVDEDGTLHSTDNDGNAVFVPVADDDGAATFYVKVGGNVRLGKKTIALFDAASKRLASDSITITSLPLTVVPATAVAGQEITVEGTGFSGGDYVELITVGGKSQNALSNGNLLSDEDRRTRATSSGRVVLTFMVPDGVTDGSKSVQVTDSTGRIGSVDLTVPKPAVTLDPASSRRGTTVVVSGSGFPARESIDILYDGQREGSARSDSTGDWAVTLNIPNNAVIGGSPDVEGNVVIGDVTYSAKAKHTVPGEEMTLSPEMARGGDTVTITGTGFPAYRPVSVKVGILSEINTGTNTDGNGDFSTSILLPALDVGTHLVQASVGDSSATKVLTVPSADMAAVTTATDVVFADLISADNLERVYHYVNATSTWLVYDPRPDFAEFNDYTETTGGQAVWVKVSDAAQFQGEPLFSGWNLIVLR